MTDPIESKKVPSRTEQPFGVVLPCAQENFSDFISGLLGESQKISKVVFGQFEIVHEKITNFHHLLVQRIRQNHGSVLVSVVIKVVFNDNSIVSFNRIVDFEAYNEIRPLIPLAVHLSWTLLIQFPGKKVPEKQTVDVSIVSNRYKNIPIYDPKDIVHLMASFTEGYISFCISHTMRSWGADIESLFSNYIETLMFHESHLRKTTRDKAGYFSFLFSFFMFLSGMGTLFYYFYRYNKLYSESTRQFLLDSSQDIAARMNYIAQLVSDSFWSKFIFFSVVFIFFTGIISVFSGIMMNYILEKKIPSFILLTDKSKQEKERIAANITFKKIKFGLTIVVSFAVNILAAICYDHLMR